MDIRDPATCRRALREIGAIAAVARLEGGQMTEQEALQAIAAIAGWVSEDVAGDGAGCGETIGRLHAMTASVDFEAQTDQAAIRLFGAVLRTIQGSSPSAPAEVSP